MSKKHGVFRDSWGWVVILYMWVLIKGEASWEFALISRLS